MSRPIATLVASAAALAAFAGPRAAMTQEELGCASDMQCKGERICEAGKCVDPHPVARLRPAQFPGEAPPEPARPPSAWRSTSLGLFYLASPPVAGPLRSAEATQALGVELGLRMSGELRWAFAFAYQAATNDGLILSGFRAEPATLGYRFTPFSRGRWMIGIEPAVRFASIEVYGVPSVGVEAILSSGFSLSGLVALDRRYYARVEPIGFDVRWFFFGSSIHPDPDVGLQWRFRVAAGFLLGAGEAD